MIMKQKNILLIILSFAGCIMLAQSTGFMGKRLSVGYGIHTSPAILGGNANNETMFGTGGSATSGSFAWNFIHEGNLEFAMSSKWMMCFSVRYYKTVYDNAKEVNGNYLSSMSYYGSPSGYYDIRGLTYSLYFKYYGTRYVAPWGRYVMFGPTINTVKATYDPTIMYFNTYDSYIGSTSTKITNFGTREQTYTGVNLMFGFGRSRIIGNRVIIDYGCNTQIISVITGALNIVTDNAINDITTSKTTNTNYIENTVRTRVQGINRFNVFLKVGVLLF
jgi:hypothetical protein